MALTRNFRETVQARVRSDKDYRGGLLRDAVEAWLSGEAALGREILRDFIKATLGFPALAEKTGIHVKSLHQMFGPKGNPTATNLSNILACLQAHEGVRLQVVA
jgi:DNA-binding phage protein